MRSRHVKVTTGVKALMDLFSAAFANSKQIPGGNFKHSQKNVGAIKPAGHKLSRRIARASHVRGW